MPVQQWPPVRNEYEHEEAFFLRLNVEIKERYDDEHDRPANGYAAAHEEVINTTLDITSLPETLYHDPSEELGPISRENVGIVAAVLLMERDLFLARVKRGEPEAIAEYIEGVVQNMRFTDADRTAADNS